MAFWDTNNDGSKTVPINIELNDSSLTSVQQQLDSLRKSLEGTTKQLSQAVKTDIIARAISDYNNMIKTLKDYEETLKGLATAEKDYQDEIKELRKGGLSSKDLGEYNRLQNELGEIREQKELVQKMMADLEKKRPSIEKRLLNATPKEKAVKNDNEEQKQMNLLGLLKETITTKAQLAKEKTALPFSSDMQGAQSNIQALSKHMKELNSIWGSMKGTVVTQVLSTIGNLAKSAGSAIASGLVNGFKLAISGAKQLASSIMSLASGAFNALKSAVSTTLGNMQRLVSGGFNAVKNGVGALKSGLHSVRSTMQSLVKKGTPNLMRSLTSLKSMLMRRIKRTFISSIFNQAREGLQQLAKSSEEFNQTMSNLKNSAKQVSGNLAITLGNLLQTVEPVLSTLLGWINSIFEAINGLFALLSGKKTMLVAKKGTDDYAKSLNSASGAAKDLNHQLYGFDEITRQEADNGSGSGAGKIQYEEQEIGDALGSINDFFKQMLEAFQAGEFKRVGELVADQLDNVVSNIDGFVEGLRSEATKWTANIAEILNGLVESFDFHALGDLIGDGLNLAFDVVNTFLSTFKFDVFGKQFAEGINGIFDAVEWDLVGETIANYLNSVWDFIGNFFGSLDWQGIGYKLSIGVGSLFENIKWEKFEKMWQDGINGIVNVLWTFVDGVDWRTISAQFFRSLNNIINGINWNDLSALVSDGVNGILDAFEALVDSNFFVNLASKLGEAVGDILKDINWFKLFVTLSLGLAQLRTAFWSFIDNLDLPNLALKLSEGINSLLDDEKVKEAWNISHEKAVKGLNKIIDAFSNFVTDIKFEEIMKELGTKVGDLFNKVNWERLGSVVKTGFTKAVVGFTGFVERINLPSIGAKLASGVNSLFDSKTGVNFSEIAGNVATGINQIIATFSALINGNEELGIEGINFASIRQSLTEGISTLLSETDFTTLIDTIGKGVTSASTEFFKLVTDIFNPQEVDGVKPKSLGQQLADGINSIFHDENGKIDENTFVGLGESFGEAIKGVFTDINKFLTKTDWKAIGESIGNALGSVDWLGIAGSIITFLWNALVAAVNTVGGLVGAFIRKLFGITDVEVFDGTASEWAKQFSESIDDNFEKHTSKQRTLEVAALYASGLSNSFITQWSQEQSKINTAVESHANRFVELFNGLLKESSDGLSNAEMGFYTDQFSKLVGGSKEVAQELISTLVSSFENGEFGELTFEQVMSGLLDADSTDAIIQHFKNLGIKIPEELANGLLGAQTLSTEAGKELIANLQNAQSLEEAKTYFSQAGIDVGDAFASAIAGESTENIAAALMLLGQGVDEATIVAMDTSHLSENLSNYMKDTGKDLTTIAEELGVDVGNGIGDIIPETIAKALKIGTENVKRVKGEMVEEATVSSQDVQTGADKAGEFGSKTTGAIADETNKGKEEVDSATKSVTSAIEEEYQKLPEDVKPYAEQLMKYISTALADGDGTVKSAIEAVAQSAVDSARDILAGWTGIEIGEVFIDGIMDGMWNREDSLTVTASQLGTFVTWAMEGKLSYNKGYSIGRDLMIGLNNGIADMGDTVLGNVKTICENIIYMTKQVFDWGSPSKVFENIGGYVMEGLQIGLEDSGKDAIETVADVAEAITEAGEDASFDMSDNLAETTSQLERIADIFADLTDIIAKMGGLQIPTIASGQTIPYSTQVGSNFGGVGSGVDTEALENAFYSAFTRAIENSSNNGTQNVNVYLDGKQISDSVTKYQRRQARAMGV